MENISHHLCSGWMGFIYLSVVSNRLFCHTGDISLLVPSRQGPLGTKEWPGRWMLTLEEGRCPELPEEDMSAALTEQGIWKRSLPL